MVPWPPAPPHTPPDSSHPEPSGPSAELTSPQMQIRRKKWRKKCPARGPRGPEDAAERPGEKRRAHAECHLRWITGRPAEKNEEEEEEHHENPTLFGKKGSPIRTTKTAERRRTTKTAERQALWSLKRRRTPHAVT